jgi:hypothetical protein
MKPVDHINPIVPGNWVRRTEDQRRQREPKKAPKQNRDQKQPPGQDPDGRTHIIDELA